MKKMKYLLSLFAVFVIYTSAAQQIEIIPQTGHAAGVTKLCFSPESDFLASIDSDNELIIWDVRLAKQIASYKIDEQYKISSIYFNKNATKVGIKSETSQWISVDLENSQLSQVNDFPDIFQQQTALDISIKSYLLIRTGQYKKVSNSIENRFLCFTVSDKNNLLFAGNEDNRIYVYNYSNGKKRLILDGHLADINDVVISPDQTLLASASEDRTIILWSVKDLNMKKVIQLKTIEELVSSLTPKTLKSILNNL